MEMTKGSLMAHRQSNQKLGQEGKGILNTSPPPPRETQNYRISFLVALMHLIFPVEGCQGGETIWINLQVHFTHRHMQESIVIMEEIHHPYSRCSKCYIFISKQALNGRHHIHCLTPMGGGSETPSFDGRGGGGRGGNYNHRPWPPHLNTWGGCMDVGDVLYCVS